MELFGLKVPWGAPATFFSKKTSIRPHKVAPRAVQVQVQVKVLYSISVLRYILLIQYRYRYR
jgi:hypothetical protein